METELVDKVRMARKEGYTWGSISLHLGIPESTLKYYVKSDPKPQKPIAEWWSTSVPIVVEEPIKKGGLKLKPKEEKKDYSFLEE